MAEDTALRLALDLMHVPSRVRHARECELPDGMELLLRVAAGDEDARRRAAELTSRPEDKLGLAAAFFVEQILLADESDSYRVLGARRDASAGELRRNMALLARHFHPDVASGAEHAIFAGRVTRAWNDVKSPQRRSGYDTCEAGPARAAGLRPRSPTSQPRRYGRFVVRAGAGLAGGHRKRPGSQAGWLGRLLMLLLGSRARR